MNLKKVVAGAGIAGALGFTALGLGAGVANADPSAPGALGIAWQQGQQDGGHGYGDGDHGDWGNRGAWGLPPPWWWFVPPSPWLV